eukprot:TRINITY_DN11974_c0_g1_i3.p1 TRINITY_DN11974_c0_g1~~TRINITY_DN11974_c0_g1_i3.p1  ORF type:complete len:177 (-),score=32.37 TRINITY_DN11974_c0_g1_i3:202-732(-)
MKRAISPHISMVATSARVILALGVVLYAYAQEPSDAWVEQATNPPGPPTSPPTAPAPCDSENAIERGCTPQGCRSVGGLRTTKREANRYVEAIEGQIKECFNLNQDQYLSEEAAAPTPPPTKPAPCTPETAVERGCTPPNCSPLKNLKIALSEALEYRGFNEMQLKDCYNLNQYDS